MSSFGKARAWMRAVFLRSRAEREMHAEMMLHIEQAAERLIARGMSERDAMYEARKEFGHASVLQEEARDARGGQWVDTLQTDVKHALRYFLRTPMTTMTIVLVLTLGISVNSAVFSLALSTRRVPAGVSQDPSLVAIRGMTLFPGRELIVSSPTMK